MLSDGLLLLMGCWWGLSCFVLVWSLSMQKVSKILLVLKRRNLDWLSILYTRLDSTERRREKHTFILFV